MNQLPPDQLREIPKWTRAYARNRTLPALVLMAAQLALFAVAMLFFARGGAAYKADERTLGSVWLAAGLLCIAANMSTAIPAVMRKVQRWLFHALYGREGELSAAPARDRKPWSYVVAALFIVGVLGQVILGSRIPERYLQPVSALYLLPFLIFIASEVGIAGILYPLLYGLHTVLMLVGVPPPFHGEWAVMNMVVPFLGYGILSLVVGHVYNRIALRRLRSLARPS